MLPRRSGLWWAKVETAAVMGAHDPGALHPGDLVPAWDHAGRGTQQFCWPRWEVLATAPAGEGCPWVLLSSFTFKRDPPTLPTVTLRASEAHTRQVSIFRANEEGR